VRAAFSGNCVVHVADPYSDPRFNPEPDRRTGFVTRNLLSSPMADLDGEAMGVIQAVNKRGSAFGENDEALVRLIAEQAGVAIQRHRLQIQAIEAIALKHEMNLARRAQQALIPKHPPNVPGLVCCGWTLPASVTGGDCFDLWTLPDGRLGIFVADASGHGIGPALVVSQVRTLVRALSEMVGDPHQILARVNARLADDLDWGQFVTAFLGFLTTDGELQWSSAGHGPLLFRRTADGPVELLDPPVQPLGVVLKWFDPAPDPIQIEPGGQLILVTDGIFEAATAGGEQMGVERMCAVVEASRHELPEAILAALRNEARAWYGKDEPADDQTVVIVQRERAGAGGGGCR
jgi:sigma-B regulation protein RsbU (phosphoserine phosphatase)